MKSRKLYIQYFTGKCMRKFIIDVPKISDEEKLMNFKNLLSNIAVDAVWNFDEEGGTYEKRQA